MRACYGPSVSNDARPVRPALVSALGARGARRIPRVPGLVRAAVAIVLVPGHEGLCAVLIGRPVRKGDRWSGDVAFPGGLARPDEYDVDTARRETLEEVGLVLGAPIGRLGDRMTLAPGRRRPMRVRPLVFLVETEPVLIPDPREVAMVRIEPLGNIARCRRVPTRRQIGPIRAGFPSIPLGDHVLWGLTLDLCDELDAALSRAGVEPR